MIEKPARPGRIAAASALTRRALLVLAVACGLAAGVAALHAQVRGTYLYTLSNFGGKVPYNWAQIHVDRERDEIYVIYHNLVRVFGPSGMEIFGFGDDLDVGQIADVVVDGNGDIVLLSHKNAQPSITRCNFRGVPIGPLEIRNLPDGLVFAANRMAFRNGRLYFASLGAGSIIVTEANGEFREHIDLAPLLEADEKQKSQLEIVGFSVDGDGSIYFTVPVMFKVFKLSPDKTLASFGRPGSVAGRFGIVAGVVVDSKGHVIVADKLRSVIMTFDKDFTFIGEFGYRGKRPENLILPDALAIDKRDRLYVTQAGKRGVSVFALGE